MRVLLEQLADAHDHPRRAEAALQRVVLMESRLYRMQCATARRQTFDGRDRRSIRHHGKHRTGFDGLPVDIDGAGAALRRIATDMGSCKAEIVSQQMDQQLPSAITQVTELEARELLACHRFSTELERIGDLLWWVTQRAQNLPNRLPKPDSRHLVGMVEILEKMLMQLREGFTRRDLEPAGYVLRADREIDQAYKSLFRRQLLSESNKKVHSRADVLLMAQALERAGDHATNLAEELFRLVEGQSLRHIPKKRVKD